MLDHFTRWMFSNTLNVFDVFAILIFVDIMQAGYYGWGIIIFLSCCIFSAFIKVSQNYD